MSEPNAGPLPWLPAARAGSREALGQALEACRGYLLLVAQRELADDLRAKVGPSDLVQQTLLDAVKDFACFAGDSQTELFAWLRRLLLNNLTDLARQYRHTGKRDLGREAAGPDQSSLDPAGMLPGGLPSPSGAAIAAEEVEAVERGLRALPENYRQIILRRYRDEWSFEEIGAELGLTPNAARKLLLRAIRRMQEELGET
jgi:RNA polymerase sigma-70 factor (ECF subfamily)